MGSCTSKTPSAKKSSKKSASSDSNKVAISILNDNTEKTDGRFAECPKDKLLNILLGENQETGGTISFMGLSSVSLSKREEITLQPFNYKNDGETEVLFDDRKNEEFMPMFDSLYKKYLGPSKEDSFSRLYKPILLEIKRLEGVKADKKFLIMFGDAIEHSQDGNFYKIANRKPEGIASEIEEKVGKFPDDPKGLKVIFIYTAKNQHDEDRHDKAMEVWKVLFEKHSISYEEKPNL